MKVNSNAEVFQCYACGFMEDDFSYFQVLSCEEELICMGCYEKYQDNTDIYIEDGE